MGNLYSHRRSEVKARRQREDSFGYKRRLFKRDPPYAAADPPPPLSIEELNRRRLEEANIINECAAVKPVRKTREYSYALCNVEDTLDKLRFEMENYPSEKGYTITVSE